MRKTFVSMLAVGVVTFAMVAAAAAEGTQALVKVPVQFIVGNKVMPAGTYRITSQTNDWSVVMVESVDSPLIAFASTKAVADAAKAGTDVQVAFTNYEGHYFLQQIAIPGGRSHRLPVDKEMAQQTLAKLNLSATDRGEPAK